MPIKTGEEAIILLLFPSPEDIKIKRMNRTQIEKMLFLLQREAGFDIDDYKFKPDNYGPCAGEMYDDLDMLLDLSILEIETRIRPPDLIYMLDAEIHEQDSDNLEKYHELSEISLTDVGKKVAQQLYNDLNGDEKLRLNHVKHEFGSLPLNDLIRYIYTKYPAFITESKIKDKVLSTAFSSKPLLTKFKRDEDDFRF